MQVRGGLVMGRVGQVGVGTRGGGEGTGEDGWVVAGWGVGEESGNEMTDGEKSSDVMTDSDELELVTGTARTLSE